MKIEFQAKTVLKGRRNVLEKEARLWRAVEKEARRKKQE